jgi:DNA-directed RNA polymerase specialized sigma24 family protein
MVYCLVPSEVAPRMRRQIKRALRGEPGVAVVREQRTGERRRAGGRRSRFDADRASPERRRIRYTGGRRIAERRGEPVPAIAPALPGVVRHHADLLSFVETTGAPADFGEEIDAVRAIVRFQAGEGDGLAELCGRWFDPVYTYLRVTLDRRADVDQHLWEVFADVLRELPRVAPSPTQVRPWLFGLAFGAARSSSPGLVSLAPANGDRDIAEADDRRDEKNALDWLTDDDLLLLIEQRPAAERHVLALRHFAELSFAEIARIMRVEPRHAAAFHRAAIDALNSTLAAITRSPRVQGRHAMCRLTHHTPVLQQRQRALLAA